MATEIEIHPVQASILRALLFKKGAGFTELNTTGLTNDHFTFHIKSLVALGFVEKKDNKKYQLTTKGKEFANRMDTDRLELERQAKIGVLIVCIRKDKRETKYLVQQRLKQPYYGFYGFPTGKVKWGETVRETAKRELAEETGLKARLTLVGVKHKMDYSKSSAELLEDKYFFVFKGEDTQGKLLETFEGGKNTWLTRGKIVDLPNLFDGVEETIEMASQDKLIFSENKYKVSSY